MPPVVKALVPIYQHESGVQLVSGLSTTAFLKPSELGSVEYGTTVALLQGRRELVIELPYSDPSVFRNSHNPLLKMIADCLCAQEIPRMRMKVRVFGMRFEVIQKKGESMTRDQLDEAIAKVMAVVKDLCAIGEHHTAEAVHSTVRHI